MKTFHGRSPGKLSRFTPGVFGRGVPNNRTWITCLQTGDITGNILFMKAASVFVPGPFVGITARKRSQRGRFFDEMEFAPPTSENQTWKPDTADYISRETPSSRSAVIEVRLLALLVSSAWIDIFSTFWATSVAAMDCSRKEISMSLTAPATRLV